MSRLARRARWSLCTSISAADFRSLQHSLCHASGYTASRSYFSSTSQLGTNDYFATRSRRSLSVLVRLGTPPSLFLRLVPVWPVPFLPPSPSPPTSLIPCSGLPGNPFLSLSSVVVARVHRADTAPGTGRVRPRQKGEIRPFVVGLATFLRLLIDFALSGRSRAFSGRGREVGGWRIDTVGALRVVRRAER